MIARPLVKTHESLAADGTIVRTRSGVVESGIASRAGIVEYMFYLSGMFWLQLFRAVRCQVGCVCGVGN